MGKLIQLRDENACVHGISEHDSCRACHEEYVETFIRPALEEIRDNDPLLARWIHAKYGVAL